MLAFCVIFFIISNVKSTPYHSAVAYDIYNMTTIDDVVYAITDPANTTNLRINLFSASSGSYAFCIMDVTGNSDTNWIEIAPIGSDTIEPGNFNSSTPYILSVSGKVSVCFMAYPPNSAFYERRFR